MVTLGRLPSGIVPKNKWSPSTLSSVAENVDITKLPIRLNCEPTGDAAFQSGL